MKQILCGMAVSVGLLCVWAELWPARGQAPNPLSGLPTGSASTLPANFPRSEASVAAGPGLLTLSQGLERYQQITVVDPQRRVLAVYQIEHATGKVSLKSVRQIAWDLEMAAFNTNDPQPADIRAMLGQ